jgi:transcriptional regulator with XRE-family HTH domain
MGRMAPLDPEAFIAALSEQIHDEIVTAKRADTGRRLSVRQVAQHVGMQPTQLGRYLNGQRDMPVSILPRVLNAIEDLAGTAPTPHAVIRRAQDRINA